MEAYLGRKIIKKIEFDDKGTFRAYYVACGWLKDNGYSYGSTCASLPLGFVKGEWNMPYKWKNMTVKQRKKVDGVVIGDLREGVVTLIFFNN